VQDTVGCPQPSGDSAAYDPPPRAGTTGVPAAYQHLNVSRTPAARRLDCNAQIVSESEHERCQAQDRNLQTIWRSVRANEQDAFSTIRPEKMVGNWFRGVLVRASCRYWFQFSVAIWQFSITSSDPGHDPSSLGAMETVADGSRYCACAAFFCIRSRADVVESAWQFYLYRLYRSKPGSNRWTMAWVSKGREQLLLIPARGHVRHIAVGRINFGKRLWGELLETRRERNGINRVHRIDRFPFCLLGFNRHFC